MPVNTNRALNIAASLAALLAFLLTGNPVMLFATFAVLFFLLLGAPLVRTLEQRSGIAFDLKPSCEVGGDLSLSISLRRPPVFRSSVELVFECRNVFLDTTVRVPVTLSPAPGVLERFELPLDTSRVGRVSVELVSAQFLDVFGFSSVALGDAEFSASYTVYPAISDIETVARRAWRSAQDGLVFDRYKKGQDLSEVFELRDYHDGDPLRRIHWKLSARFDELMVREPSHPADFDLALGLMIHGRDAELERRGAVVNAAAGMLGTVSRSLLRRSLGHCIVYRNGSALEVDPVESELGFEHALDAVLGTTLPLDVQREARDFTEVQRSHGISKLVLVTDTVQEPLFEGVAALCELTVIFLGTEGGPTVDDSDGYTLIRLSTEALASRVKSLEV